MGNRMSQLFGASSEKNAEPVPSPIKVNKQEEEINRKIQAEKIANHLVDNAEVFRNKQLKYQAKINNLKKKAKQYLQSDKQKQAKKLLLEVARINQQLQRVQVRRRLIEGQTEQVETHALNRQVIDAIQAAHELTKQDLTGKLQDHIITAQENKVIQEQINQNMKQLVHNSEEQEQAQDLFKQLEEEVQKDNKRKILNKSVKVVNTQKPSASLQQKTKQDKQFQNMLAEL